MSFKSRGLARLIGVLITCALLGATTQQAQALTWLPKLCSGFADCNNRGMGNGGYQNEYNISHWGMYAGHNCTNYAAYRLIKNGIDASYLRGQGNGWQWGGVASSHGVAVDGNPRVGDIAWFSSTSGVGSSGHVAYVEAVSGSRVTVSEDNWGGDFDWRQYNISDVTGFIHFGGGGSGPPDSDGDGTPDASDRCPSQGGPTWTAGCPDADSDGITDLDDVCPQSVGPSGTRGCPPEEYDSTSLSDFNGDGRSDVAAFYDYGGPGGRAVGFVFTGGPSGLSHGASQFWDSGAGNFDMKQARLVGGDFNGDGRSDVAAFYDYGGPGGQARGFMFTGSPSGLSSGYQQFWDSGAGNFELGRARLVGGFVPPIPKAPGSPPPTPPGANPGDSGGSPNPGQGTGAQVAAPAAVAGVRVRFPAKRVAVLSWSAPANATSYTARVSNRNSTKKWRSWHMYNSPSVRLTNLKRGATYRLQITPQGPGGYGTTTTWRFKQRR